MTKTFYGGGKGDLKSGKRIEEDWVRVRMICDHSGSKIEKIC